VCVCVCVCVRVCVCGVVDTAFGVVNSQPPWSCFQEFPEAMPAAKRCANNPAKLFVIPEATQLAVVAPLHQGTFAKSFYAR